MPNRNIVPGRVYAFEPGRQQPPTSSLADAFFAQDGLLADAVVLRGYLGRSPILTRAHQYLTGALDAVQAAAKAAADAPALPEPELLVPPDDAPYCEPENDFVAKAGRDRVAADEEIKAIQGLIAALDKVSATAQPHVPWRIYLTPTLNRYVDFHLSSMLAWRQEPRVDRKDTFTVWLRAFATDGKPLPYRIVEETIIGPSYSTYLGGDLVDDFLDQSRSSSSAWGDQSGVYGGGRPGTGKTCLGT
jgi:hypothetical protein